jgi:putative ABC transport system permease protein
VNLLSGSLDGLHRGELLVAKDQADSHGWTVGDTVKVKFARTGERSFRIGGVFDTNQLLGTYVDSLDIYNRNFTEHLDSFVLVTRAPGVSPQEAERHLQSIKRAFPNVRLEDQDQFRKTQADQVNQLLGLIIGLLGIALFIAFFGIMNTLALSVFERTREIGLLRAVGMSRRQVRSMIRWEGVMIVVYGCLLGLAIGVFFGWAMTRALRDQGIVAFTVPVGQLVIFLVVAAFLGLVAALLPAWRASRLDVLRAVTVE